MPIDGLITRLQEDSYDILLELGKGSRLSCSYDSVSCQGAKILYFVELGKYEFINNLPLGIYSGDLSSNDMLPAVQSFTDLDLTGLPTEGFESLKKSIQRIGKEDYALIQQFDNDYGILERALERADMGKEIGSMLSLGHHLSIIPWVKSPLKDIEEKIEMYVERSVAWGVVENTSDQVSEAANKSSRYASTKVKQISRRISDFYGYVSWIAGVNKRKMGWMQNRALRLYSTSRQEPSYDSEEITRSILFR